jgi:hypothetical protein
MTKRDVDNNAEFEFEEEAAAGICSTCTAVMADIYKAIFLQQIAKIEFEPAGEGYTVTSADFDRVCEAAERARVVAQIGLDGYQDGMRRIAQQNH